MKWKYLGPGLLYAGAAVGVSHLVQSTRAGALYGFELLLIVILINILKYPFFEIGTRYTIATGRPLQEGYRDIGNWALIAFFIVTVGTMFIIVSVVTLVTGGLIQNLLGLNMESWVFSGIILLFSTLVLVFGKYKALDFLIRLVILLMTVTTIVSLIFAIFDAPAKVNRTESFSIFNDGDMLFLVALLGWMPIPIEAAVWQSDWTLESRKKHGGVLPEMKHAMIDFNVGYWGTTVLAIVFLSLGALMMHGSGEVFSPKSVEFSKQLIEMISRNLGDWAYPIIAVGATMTMVSTTFTCLDAYPRVITKTIQVYLPDKVWNSDLSYRLLLVIVSIGSVSVLFFYQNNMRTMVDFATSVSFVTAPILAYLHYKISNSEKIKLYAPIGRGMKILSITGLIFLTAFTIYFIYLEYFKYMNIR